MQNIRLLLVLINELPTGTTIQLNNKLKKHVAENTKKINKLVIEFHLKGFTIINNTLTTKGY